MCVAAGVLESGDVDMCMEYSKYYVVYSILFFFFQAEDGIRDLTVTGVQTCALPICSKWKELDVRVARTVQVIRYDQDKQLVRINCLETQRLSWAKLDRFNGKSGGYAPFGEARAPLPRRQDAERRR